MDIKSLIDSLGEKKEELIKQAVQCKNQEELLALAERNGLVLGEEGAKKLFELMNQKPGQLSDEELDSVAGGARYKQGSSEVICNNCNYREVSRYPLSKCSVCGSEDITNSYIL